MVDVVSFNAVLKCLVGGACWSQVGQLDMGTELSDQRTKTGWILFCLMKCFFDWLDFWLAGCFFGLVRMFF